MGREMAILCKHSGKEKGALKLLRTSASTGHPPKDGTQNIRNIYKFKTVVKSTLLQVKISSETKKMSHHKGENLLVRWQGWLKVQANRMSCIILQGSIFLVFSFSYILLKKIYYDEIFSVLLQGLSHYLMLPWEVVIL